MRTRRRTWKWATAATAAAAFELIVPVFTDTAMASAVIEVAIGVPNEPFFGGPVDWTIVVSNPGSEVLESLVVTAQDADRPVTGPTVTEGNNDARLDPGEVWTYSAGRVADMHGRAVVNVTASTSTAENVTATDSITYPMKDVLSGSISTASTSVVAGTMVEWLVEYKNVADFAVTIADGGPQGRVLYPEWTGPISTVSLTPVSLGPDGDAVMAAGEVWTWRFSGAVTIDGSYLSVSGLGYRPPDGEGPFGAPELSSASISVTGASTPTPINAETPTSPTAPQTGARTPAGTGVLPNSGQRGADMVWVASALTAAGAMMCAAARRRVVGREERR